MAGTIISGSHSSGVALNDAATQNPATVDSTGFVTIGSGVQPDQDLFLASDHAIFVAGTLIPVKMLINGQTIRQVEAAEVTWFHVEPASHDILLANGLAAETYLDTGNRSAFERERVQTGDATAQSG